MSDSPTPPEGMPPVAPTETFPRPPMPPPGSPPAPGSPPPPGYPPAPPGYPAGPPTTPPPGGGPPPYLPYPPGAQPVGPPPPAKHRNTRVLVIVLGLVALLALGAAVVGWWAWNDANDELGDFDRAPGSAYEIDPSACTQDVANNPVFRFRFTNTSGDRRNFRVEVSFLDGAEGIGPAMADTTGSLAAGEGIDMHISGLEPPASGNFTCKVTEVRFSGR